MFSAGGGGGGMHLGWGRGGASDGSRRGSSADRYSNGLGLFHILVLRFLKLYDCTVGNILCSSFAGIHFFSLSTYVSSLYNAMFHF